MRTLLFVLFGAALLALTVLGKLPRYGLMAALGLLIMVDLIGVDQRYLNNERNKSQYAHYISDLDRLVPQTPDAADLEIYEAGRRWLWALIPPVQRCSRPTGIAWIPSATKRTTRWSTLLALVP